MPVDGESLNTLTTSASALAWACSAPVAAADSSTSAAFCWVIWSICVTAWLTCSIPAVCSWLAAEISPMMSVTRRTLATISSMVLPAESTWALPSSTLPTESSMSCLISLAAAAERWARVRTSEATTAKPRPWSPARAASTAAFSARMLVWKAMESMTPMMSTILREASLMADMVCTTWATAEPPRTATWEAAAASWLACWALAPFCLTVEVSSSMEAAVCSSELACSSVRADRSWLPDAIWPLAVAMESVPWRTWPTMRCRLSFMCCRACSSWPVSSLPCTSMRLPRSPAATACARLTACCRGRATLRAISSAMPRPKRTAPASRAITHQRAAVKMSSPAWLASSMPWALILSSSSSLVLMARLVLTESPRSTSDASSVRRAWDRSTIFAVCCAYWPRSSLMPAISSRSRAVLA